jgi:hypothetical protein
MSYFWMTRRSFAEVLLQKTGGVKEHRRKVTAAQCCSVVGPAATKLGYVRKTGVVHQRDWASLVSGLVVARHLAIE